MTEFAKTNSGLEMEDLAQIGQETFNAASNRSFATDDRIAMREEEAWGNVAIWAIVFWEHNREGEDLVASDIAKMAFDVWVKSFGGSLAFDDLSHLDRLSWEAAIRRMMASIDCEPSEIDRTGNTEFWRRWVAEKVVS